MEAFGQDSAKNYNRCLEEHLDWEVHLVVETDLGVDHLVVVVVLVLGNLGVQVLPVDKAGTAIVPGLWVAAHIRQGECY